jgi:biopolymer transport protein ExbD
LSAQSSWGWRPHQTEGIWRHGCAWTKPLFAAVPWVTLTILLALFAIIGDRLPQVPGLVCDLPPAMAGEGVSTGLAALVLRGSGADTAETCVFFDDAGYSLSDEASVASLKEHIGVRAESESTGTILLLADRRVPSGDIHRLAGLARESGLRRVQIAERRE